MSNRVSKIDEMNYFLKHIGELSEHGVEIDSDVVYNVMEEYGVRNSDYKEGDLANIKPEYFPKWIQHFKQDVDIRVFIAPNWRYFCQFVSNDRISSDEYIKLYIPMDKEHIYKGSIDLFEYVASLGVPHESKISSEIRSDDVIIRLSGDDKEAAKKIIDYIRSNNYITEGLTRVNPFVPVVDGIGIMKESGISYNNTMAKLISYYINNIVSNQNEVSIDDFKSWLVTISDDYNKCPVNYDDLLEVKSVFETAYDSQKVPVFDDIEEKKNNRNDNMTIQQKNHLFLDSIFATYDKYGAAQVNEAIMHAINGDFSGFTNGNGSIKFRNQLKQNVSSAEIENFIRTTIKIVNESPINNIKNGVNEYVSVLLQNKMATDLDEICAVTLDNYDEEHLYAAFNQYIDSGNANAFSRFSQNGDNNVNYRKKIMTYTKEALTNSIGVSLALKGIDITELERDEIVPTYVHTLSKSLYQKPNSI